MTMELLLQNKLLRIEEVCQLLGFKTSTIYKYIKEKNFPKPIKLSSRASRWKYKDIENWLNQFK